MLNSNNFYLKGSLMALLGAGRLQRCRLEPHVYDPVAFTRRRVPHLRAWRSPAFPAPRARRVAKQGAMKFCSTAEMFGWWLQPGEPGTRCHPVCA